ncbi:MAG TPA: hypothetical protein PK597_00195 [Oscillospiraceae bacterium]|nr:hypothetical protein [Oscillospiraceae bacterium]
MPTESYLIVLVIPPAVGLYFLARKVKHPIPMCALVMLGCLIWTAMPLISSLSDAMVRLLGGAYYIPLFAAFAVTKREQYEEEEREARKKFALDDDFTPPPPPEELPVPPPEELPPDREETPRNSARAGDEKGR